MYSLNFLVKYFKNNAQADFDFLPGFFSTVKEICGEQYGNGPVA